MNSTDTRFIVKAVAAVLIVWALFLHGCFLVSAGALWRDEANSVNQANLESWRAMWESLRYDSFPALYPAILRILLYGHQPFSEKRVRILGVVVGVAFLVSLWSATRVMGSPFPVVALALLAVDPVFISEGDSVRPYGIGLLCLLWSYCAYGRLLVTPGRSWIAIASVASILAVQCSYTNVMFIGVLGSSAALVRYLQRTPRMLWKVLLPSFLAALSLMPYVGALRQSRDWISILHTRVDWRQYLKSYVAAHSVAFPVVWVLMTLLGVYCLARLFLYRKSDLSVPRPLVTYASVAAVMGMGLQMVFVQAMGVPPFPRYFLPGLLLVALALELLMQGLRPSIRVTAALSVVLITAWPSWSWIRQRHTNVDIVAKMLEESATPSDLVIISPWFLHPSFQLYYSGSTPWLTVPDLPRQPLTRYDLLVEAMTDPRREARLYWQIRQTLSSGGFIWFVSQDYPNHPADRTLPVEPQLSGLPAGRDYVRFRSYWERTIVFRLYECCKPALWRLSWNGPVWVEERLVLTRWQPKAVQLLK